VHHGILFDAACPFNDRVVHCESAGYEMLPEFHVLSSISMPALGASANMQVVGHHTYAGRAIDSVAAGAVDKDVRVGVIAAQRAFQNPLFPALEVAVQEFVYPPEQAPLR